MKTEKVVYKVKDQFDSTHYRSVSYDKCCRFIEKHNKRFGNKYQLEIY